MHGTAIAPSAVPHPPYSHLHPMASGCDISIQHHCRYGALSMLLWFYDAATPPLNSLLSFFRAADLRC